MAGLVVPFFYQLVANRDLGLSRNTVKKYLNAEAEPVYQRSQQPAPKLGAHQATLATWLEQDS